MLSVGSQIRIDEHLLFAYSHPDATVGAGYVAPGKTAQDLLVASTTRTEHMPGRCFADMDSYGLPYALSLCELRRRGGLSEKMAAERAN